MPPPILSRVSNPIRPFVFQSIEAAAYPACNGHVLPLPLTPYPYLYMQPCDPCDLFEGVKLWVPGFPEPLAPGARLPNRHPVKIARMVII